MPSYNDYRRSRRRAAQSDAVAIALTTQVLVCVILLLAAALIKQVSPPAYGSVKQEYDNLVTDPPDGESAFAGLSELGGLSGIFTQLENWITSLLGQVDGQAAPPPAEDAPALGDAEPQADQPAWEFDYDYLGEGQILRAGMAMGGQYPVGAGSAGAALPAPAGATYAAVELAGNPRPPLTGPVTSPYAYREHPLSGAEDFHTGIDIAAAEGRAVLAVLPGQVIEVGEDDIYGKFITLQHAPNLQTFYAHCSEIIAAEGMQVRQGERIAKVGHTGVATGPHLHFSVLVDGLYTDPFWILRDNIRPVAG